MSTPLDGAIAVWYLLTAGALVFLIWDLLNNTPTARIMKLAWVLVVFYTGPIGLFLYFLSCRQPLPGTHDAFIAAHWKQATGSLLHCVAGDATGIILSAAVVYRFGLPNGADLIIEYLAAFVVGLFVFQALFMRSMYGGNYWLAVRKTFFAETVSMNMVMVGMIPTMVILMRILPEASNPFYPTFWAVMSLATMAGMLTAYPINSWMVRRGLKHGMMSAMAMPERGPAADAVDSTNGGMRMPQEMGNGMMMPAAMPSGHQGTSFSPGRMAGVLILTFGALGLALWVTSLFAPITLSGLE